MSSCLIIRAFEVRVFAQVAPVMILLLLLLLVVLSVAMLVVILTTWLLLTMLVTGAGQGLVVSGFM